VLEALIGHGFVPVTCPILVEAPPLDPTLLRDAAARLERYDWVMFASARAVRALGAARLGRWPEGVRTAAVGAATARALVDAGAGSPLVADEGGAEPLWTVLRDLGGWSNIRVLLPTVPGGREVLEQQLRQAGAVVDTVEAYRMCPRSPDSIAADWDAADPDALIVTSPSAAHTLIAAVGVQALSRLRAVVAIGPTTAEALAAHAVTCVVAAHTTFEDAVRTLAAQRSIEARR
jgi:uroporphyrinogen-III synthase